MGSLKRASVVAIAAVLISVGGIVFSPAPAEAAVLKNATGCGTTLVIDNFGWALSFVDTSVTLNNVRIECVIAAEPFDLGFVVLPLGVVVAASGVVDLKFVKDCNGDIFDIFCSQNEITATILDAELAACIPLSFDIRVSGVAPDRASFSCPAIQTFIKNNQPDTTRGFFGFGITTATFDMIEQGRGTVNGISPFAGFGVDLAWLNPIILPIIQDLVPGPITDNVMVNLV